MTKASRPGVQSFAVGLPAAELFPVHDLAQAGARVLPAEPGALQYAVPCAPLKRHIVDLMAARGVHCRPEQIFLTSGSQQAMDLLTRLFLDPGGEVMLGGGVHYRDVFDTKPPGFAWACPPSKSRSRCWCSCKHFSPLFRVG